jgi:hypothetical protein
MATCNLCYILIFLLEPIDDVLTIDVKEGFVGIIKILIFHLSVFLFRMLFL